MEAFRALRSNSTAQVEVTDHSKHFGSIGPRGKVSYLTDAVDSDIEDLDLVTEMDTTDEVSHFLIML